MYSHQHGLKIKGSSIIENELNTSTIRVGVWCNKGERMMSHLDISSNFVLHNADTLHTSFCNIYLLHNNFNMFACPLLNLSNIIPSNFNKLQCFVLVIVTQVLLHIALLAIISLILKYEYKAVMCASTPSISAQWVLSNSIILPWKVSTTGMNIVVEFHIMPCKIQSTSLFQTSCPSILASVRNRLSFCYVILLWPTFYAIRGFEK